MIILFLLQFLFYPATDTLPVLLLNPSFEDYPAPGRVAMGWYHCGLPTETPPDIHPSASFNVLTEPVDGQTFAGMVVRENGTYEALGQRLEKPLLAGSCYSFSLALAKSPTYTSASRTTGFRVNYNMPVILRIWGSNKVCEQTELMAQSQPVDHETWKTYSFDFRPENDYDYFFMEAYYPEPGDFKSYLGNILLDDCSPILPVHCGSGKKELEPQKIDFGDAADLDQLKELLRSEAPAISFVGGTSVLEPQYYLDESGKVSQLNLGLHRVAHAVQNLEGSQLEIVVDILDKTRAVNAYQYISWQLRDLGLSYDQFEVRTWRRSDQKIDWDAFNAEKDLYFAVKR